MIPLTSHELEKINKIIPKLSKEDKEYAWKAFETGGDMFITYYRNLIKMHS